MTPPLSLRIFFLDMLQVLYIWLSLLIVFTIITFFVNYWELPITEWPEMAPLHSSCHFLWWTEPDTSQSYWFDYLIYTLKVTTRLLKSTRALIGLIDGKRNEHADPHFQILFWLVTTWDWRWQQSLSLLKSRLQHFKCFDWCNTETFRRNQQAVRS